MDLAQLRAVLRPHVVRLSQINRHVDLPGVCQALGLPFPDTGVSKADKMEEAFDALPDDGLIETATRFLERCPLPAHKRNELQDIVWSRLPVPHINKKSRREVTRALDHDDLYLDARRFDELMDRLWILDDDGTAMLASFLSRAPYVERSLRSLIDRHVHRNPGDWSVEMLFEEIGALDCPDMRFALFLEGLASPDVRPDEAAQRRFVEVVNDALKTSGAELRETEPRDGYPQFALVQIHGSAQGKPKNLVFASEVKPDLRFRDAINNDIEVVTNADKVLIYDRPIGDDGVRWADLQAWWADANAIADAGEQKRSLYQRLLASLPRNSPPQRLLFTSFYKRFKRAFPEFPALLPEVWLHWDPKTVNERGAEALSRFRMDYLLLLPGSVRVVLEVDGKQHYADDDGRASPMRYAKLVAADRDLKLAGYHVYRFGAAELMGEAGMATAVGFFEAIFRRFRVPFPDG